MLATEDPSDAGPTLRETRTMERPTVSKLLLCTQWTQHEIYFLCEVFNNKYPEGRVDAQMLQTSLEQLGCIYRANAAENAIMCKRLLSVLDLDKDGVVGVTDWIVCAEKVVRSSVRETFQLLRGFLTPPDTNRSVAPSSGGLGKSPSHLSLANLAKGLSLRREGSGGLKKEGMASGSAEGTQPSPAAGPNHSAREVLLPFGRISETALRPDFDELVTSMGHAVGMDWLMYALGHSPLFLAFMNAILSFFAPSVTDMAKKLKNSGLQTIQGLGFGEPGGIPCAVTVLSAALIRAHQTNPTSYDFALASMRDQKTMVEAITYGVRYNTNPDEWNHVGVPLLLLGIRVYLRGFVEAIFPQYLSSHIILKATNQDAQGRLALLQDCYAWLPGPQMHALHAVMDAVTYVGSQPKWLQNVTSCLASVVINAKACDHTTPPIVDELFKVLFLNWKSFK